MLFVLSLCGNCDLGNSISSEHFLGDRYGEDRKCKCRDEVFTLYTYFDVVRVCHNYMTRYNFKGL